MQGEKAGQTKSSTFNTLRGFRNAAISRSKPPFSSKLFSFNALRGATRAPHAGHRKPNSLVTKLRRKSNPLLPLYPLLPLLLLPYSLPSILSIPIYGRKTSGTIIDPSAC